MIIDILLNLIIFLITAVIVIRLTRGDDGKLEPGRLKTAFRFFTCQSNVLCAASAMVMAAAEIFSEPVPEWVWILKYIGTASVTVTMLTVFFFLAPSVGRDWIEVLLKGRDLFLHLLTPLAALITFCVFEKRGMSFAQCLWGLLPVVYYGPLYLYKILYAPKEKRWEDFYGFNKTGKWPVSFSAMLIGTFLICLGLMGLQNI